MPTRPLEFLVFVALLVPGFVHATLRRRVVPTRSSSVLAETAHFVTVSLLSGTLSISLFALARLKLPHLLPDPQQVLVEPGRYVTTNPGEAFVLFVVLVALSTVFAAIIAVPPRYLAWIVRRVAPSIVDVPTWYHVFESGPPDHYVYAGCRLRSGGYIGGAVDWYSTDVEETVDREIALAQPLTWVEPEANEAVNVDDVERIIISARDIEVLSVTFVAKQAADQ